MSLPNDFITKYNLVWSIFLFNSSTFGSEFIDHNSGLLRQNGDNFVATSLNLDLILVHNLKQLLVNLIYHCFEFI